MESKVNEKRMSLWERFSYGMGNFGGNTGYMIVTSFLLYYCTDSLGLSAAIMGTLLMISKLLDGISDVIMGHIINITHSKLGKSRFWVILSAAPLGLTTYLLFCVPSFLPENATYAYLFIMYTLMSVVFYTMFNISCVTLTALATKNMKDRYSMATFSSILGVVPAIILSFATTYMVEFFGGGKAGWSLTALVCGFVTFLTVLWCGLVVKELPEEVLTVKEKENNKIGFIESIKLLFANKYFWILLGIYLAIYLYSGVQLSVAIYYCSYILNDATAFGWITVAMYFPLVVLIVFVSPIVNKFGPRKSNVVGAILSIIGAALIFINTKSMVFVFIGLFISTCGLLPSYVTLNPLIAEAAEYTKMKKGKDITAMFYSCSSVGVKVGMGVGTAIAGILLSFSGYDGMAEVQTEGTLRGITLIFLLAPLIGYIIMAILFFLLDIDEVNKKLKKQSEVLAAVTEE